MTTTFEPIHALLLALCVLVAFLPPRHDPAIRLKEWLMGQKRPEFRSPRVQRWLKKLSQEGYALDENGRVICSTCGPHNCGQCSSGANMIGLTLEEFRQKKGWT